MKEKLGPVPEMGQRGLLRTHAMNNLIPDPGPPLVGPSHSLLQLHSKEFTENAYHLWMPTRLDRLCSAIDQLSDLDVPPLLEPSGLS